MSKVYPAIPDPQPTVEALTESVRALKLAVEVLTGQRAGGTASHTFVQTDTPVAVAKGDVWIVPNTSLIRYWNGSNWLKLTIA